MLFLNKTKFKVKAYDHGFWMGNSPSKNHEYLEIRSKLAYFLTSVLFIF